MFYICLFGFFRSLLQGVWNRDCNGLHGSSSTGKTAPATCSRTFQNQHLNRRSTFDSSRQAGLPENSAARCNSYGFWTQSRKSRSAAHTEQKKDRNTKWHNHPIISNVVATTGATTGATTATATATAGAIIPVGAVSAAS